MPMNVEHEIEFNETVLHLAQRKDIHIQSICKGIPSCAECRVRLVQGEHHVLPPSSKEISLIGTAHYIDQSRLSCQLRCFGDVVVDLSEQVEKEGRVSKAPQGAASRADGEESFAVKGNIIEEYKEDDNKSLADKIKGDGPRPGQDSFYDDFQKKDKGSSNRNSNRNRGRNRRQNQQNRQDSGQKSAQSQGDGNKPSHSNKKRHRRRPKRQRSKMSENKS